MHEFQLPDEWKTLEDDALQALLDATLAEFDEKSHADVVTGEDLAYLRTMRDAIKSLQGEQTERVSAAAEAERELNELRNEVHGEQDAEGDDDDESGADGGSDEGGEDEGGEDEGGDGSDAEAEAEPELVTAGARRPMNVGAIRARQPERKLPEPAAARVRIVAAADVPGVAIGQELDIDTLVDGVIARATGLKSAKRPAEALVAAWHLPFPEDLVVTDASSTPEGTRAVLTAADQRRLPEGDLVASGGWCAPSETIYDIADVACPDALWSAPEIQLRRGGIQFFQTPTLDVSGMTWVHTEADDIAGAEKPCLHVPCPDPVPVRCDAIGVCLEAGILTERHFPELVAWYVRNSMVAHEIRISQAMFAGAIAASTEITADATFGAFTAVFGQVALQTADLVEKHSLCDSISVEVTFPWWAKNLFLADIARQNGRRIDEIDPALITAAFATIGVSVQFARSLGVGAMGGASPAASWPESIPFLIHPAGAFQIGRGAEVNLGAVYDSNKFVTNDYTALFTEECVALVNRGPESRYVTVPVCADGLTGGQITDAPCPIDANTTES